jgi:hypothetical protein
VDFDRVRIILWILDELLEEEDFLHLKPETQSLLHVIYKLFFNIFSSSSTSGPTIKYSDYTGAYFTPNSMIGNIQEYPITKERASICTVLDNIFLGITA